MGKLFLEEPMAWGDPPNDSKNIVLKSELDVFSEFLGAFFFFEQIAIETNN